MIYVYDIKWDAEPNEIQEQHLPETLVITDSELMDVMDIDFDYADTMDEDEISEYVSDYLSNVYGYCHNGFQMNISKQVELGKDI